MLKDVFSKGNKEFFWQHLVGERFNLVCYFFAGLFFIWGQIKIFSGALKQGLVATGFCLLWLLLALVRAERIAASATRGATIIRPLLVGLRKKAEKIQQEITPTQLEIVEQRAATAPLPDDKHSVLKSRLQAIEIRIPKIVIISIGAALMAASQPLLFWEKIVLGLILFAVGLLILFQGLKLDQSGWRIATMWGLVKALFICMPGLILMGIGNWILFRYVHSGVTKDALGLGFNAAGVLLLFSLLPRQVPDQEALPGNILNHYDGAARNHSAFLLKIGLFVSGFVLLYLFHKKFMVQQYSLALLLGLAGTGLSAFSFPLIWRREHTGDKGNALGVWAGNILRLLLFGFALYCGYKGQNLFAHEQFYPGLYHYGLAALVLVLAFREPSPWTQDHLQEKPLKWYWEAIWLLAILVLAAWLRIRLLDTIPFGIECDEAGGTNNALELRFELNSLVAHQAGAPLFTLCPRIVSTALFGIGNLGVKADAVFFGVVGIFTFYLLARLFWGPRIGLATAALMALSRWHIHFSRFGFTNTFFITLLMIAFYFLVKGLQSRSKWHFLFAGMTFALIVQSETAGRLMPLICIILLVYFLLFQKRFFQRNWKLLTALLLGAWLTGAGIFIFFAKYNHILIKRVQEVSVYSGDVNAPRQVAKGLLDNIRSSMSMLNFHGDYRTRHNGGLSGEPTLDFWTSILFALGFLYSLYYWRRWRYGIILIWFFGFMSASIFSIEAPQSHRAFGIFPAAFLLIAAFLDRSRRLLQQALGRPGLLLGLAAFLVLLFVSGRINYHKYFDTIPAFDSNCTSVARYIGNLPPEEWETVLMSAYFWQGHPPFHLYAKDMSGRFYYYAHTALPYRLETIKNVTYPLVLEYQPLLPTIQWFYPRGNYVEEKHAKYGTMFKAWEVPKEEIARTRGIIASYYNNLHWSGKPVLTRKEGEITRVFNEENWPLTGLGSIEWKGTIWIPHEGNYTFYVYGTDFIEVKIGKKLQLQAGAKHETRETVYLPAGLNRIRARARHRGGEERILFAWSSQESVQYFMYRCPHREAFFKQPFPKNYYFTYTRPVGLLETYYQTKDWTGKIARQRVQPALLYWSGFSNEFRSIEWEGQLHIEQEGEYEFELTSTGYSELWIDDILVFQRGTHPQGKVFPRRLSNRIKLISGVHTIRARCSAASGGYKLWWRTPEGKRELVPAWVLTPKED